MKKAIYLFLAVCAVTNYSVSAQKGTHELYAHYGMLSDNQLFDLIKKVAVDGIAGKSSDTKYTGNFGLTYRYGASNRFSIGIAALCERATYTLHSEDTPDQKGATLFTTIALEPKLNYFRNDNLVIYGFLGAGCTFWYDTLTEKGKQVEMPNFQLTPIGISVGKDLGGFLEIGVGYKGIVNLGAFVRL